MINSLLRISDIVAIAGISIILFLVLVLINKARNRRNSHASLVIILLSLIPLFLSYKSGLLGEEWQIDLTLLLSNLSFILLGPALYQYVHNFFLGDADRPLFSSRIYVPFTSILIILIIGYVFLSKDLYRVVLGATSVFSFIYFLVHLFLVIRYRSKAMQKLKFFYSSIENKSLHWINIFITGLCVVIILDFIAGIIFATSGHYEVSVINLLFLLALTLYLGYNGLIQGQISENLRDFELPKERDLQEQPDQHKEYEELKNRLLAVIEDKKLYQDEEVSLRMLSEYMDVPIKKVSHLINQYLDTTFYNLINTYRIDMFKKKVKDGELEHKTILALALESGFNSKATFNRVFKQFEGVTPSKYAFSSD
ncbi:helix-turn-helix domain-containing protein [Balneola sp. MJW-20]|uniref:helix-turn-helix domain-containing protein n=1 Tax=Gracilimonas aurantiaca TaxID=3234185 RepID=UPI00346559C8